MSADTCTDGEQVELWAELSDTGDQRYSYAWTQDSRLTERVYVALSTSSDGGVFFDCPPCPPGLDGAAYQVTVSVQDQSGDMCHMTAQIELSCSELDAGSPTGCACHTTGGSAEPGPARPLVGMGMVLGLVAWQRRGSRTRLRRPRP